MPYTPEELIIFGGQPDITFTEIDKNFSQKTDFLLTARNFSSLQIYLAKLKAYILMVKGSIDIDSLINQVLARYQTSKNIINIDISLGIGGISNQLVNSINYKVERVSEFIVEISNKKTKRKKRQSKREKR